MRTKDMPPYCFLHDSAPALRCRAADPWPGYVSIAPRRFADYRVPVVLRQMGILAYSADLALKVRS